MAVPGLSPPRDCRRTGPSTRRPRPEPASASTSTAAPAMKHETNSLRNRPRLHEAPRVAAQSWKLGPYLEYWLEHVVKPPRRPAPYALYEITVRLHLAPALGKYPLKRL